MIMLAALVASFLLVATPSLGVDEVAGIGAIESLSSLQFAATLPKEVQFLDDALVIERFLESLDGQPPDWSILYGQGHHDPGLDDRLFQLNRERDRRRAGNPALTRRVAFRWSGELSRFDPHTGGFSVAVGPVVTATGWGQVRFKPDDLPGNLQAVPAADSLDRFQRELAAGHVVDISVIVIGRLIPEESIIYDFSHEQDGLGLIMPVVRAEELRYVVTP